MDRAALSRGLGFVLAGHSCWPVLSDVVYERGVVSMNDNELNDMAEKRLLSARATASGDRSPMSNLPVLGDLAISATASLLSIAKNLTWITEHPNSFGKDH